MTRRGAASGVVVAGSILDCVSKGEGSTPAAISYGAIV